MSDTQKCPIRLYSDDPLIAQVVAAQAAQYDLAVQFSTQPADADLVLAAPVRLGAVIQKIRRLQQKNSPGEQIVPVGAYLFDPAQALLIAGDDMDIILTEKEAGILKCLLAAGGAYVSRRDLLNDVWGYVDGVETHTLETHVYRLRQKLEHDPARPRLLLTSEQGYCLKV